MPWAAAAAIGGALISANAAGDAADQQAESANRATDLQAQASRDAIALQREQYNQTRADALPFMQRGNAAGMQLNRLLGLPGVGVSGPQRLQNAPGTLTQGADGVYAPATQPAGGAPAPTREQLRAQLLGQFTTGGSAGETYYSGSGAEGEGSWSTGPATPGTVDEAGLNAEIERRMQVQPQQSSVPAAQGSALTTEAAAQPSAEEAADANFGRLTRDFSADDLSRDVVYQQAQPAAQAGLDRATSDLDIRAGMLNPLMHRFGMADFEKDPGYDFRLGEGVRARDQSAVARGGLYSGAQMKALERYGQDYGSAEYGKASDRFAADRSFAAGEYGAGFARMGQERSNVAGLANDSYNRFNTTNNRLFNQLSAVAGTGQTANGQVSASGQNYANQSGQSLMGAANQSGQNLMGAANVSAAAGMFGARTTANALNGGVAAYQRNQSSYAPPAYIPPVYDDGYSLGTGGAYGGNRSGM
jgi:hypothetical protein